MPQFDAYVNPNHEQRAGFPYLVVLQSDQLDHYTTRLVMPLVRLSKTPERLPRRLTERVVVLGEPLYLAAHLSAALPARLLRKPVQSLRDQSDPIREALDAVLSGV